ELVANKSGATRLGFAVLLKFFELEGRFPRHGGEVPRAAVDYLAAQLKVAAETFADYEWTGRTIEYHRAKVRGALGFRETTVTVLRLEGLVAADRDIEGRGLLAELKSDPGRLGLPTLLRELDKLERIRAVGLDPGLFADVSDKLVAAWRARASRCYPSDLRS